MGISVTLARAIASRNGSTLNLYDNTVETLTSEESAALRAEIYCIAGLLIYTPVKEVCGLQVPWPSFSDLALATSTTSILLFILHVTGHTQGWKRSALIFTGIWLVLKLFGSALIHLSGDSCVACLNESIGLFDGLYQLTALLGCGTRRVIKSLRTGCMINHSRNSSSILGHFLKILCNLSPNLSKSWLPSFVLPNIKVGPL